MAAATVSGPLPLVGRVHRLYLTLLPGQLVEAKNALDRARRIGVISERSTLRDATDCLVQQEKSPLCSPHGAWEGPRRRPTLVTGRALPR